MDWSQPPPDFSYVAFERVNGAANQHRYYCLAWWPTLFETGAVVRMFGHKGGAQRVLAPLPFASLGQAWPTIRAAKDTLLGGCSPGLL